MAKVNLNNFAGEIMKITADYADEVEDQTEKAVTKTAFEAEKKLHTAGSFHGSGKYKKGWTVTFNKLRYGLEAVVHNKDYQLTHLLESGHAKWLWGRKGSGTVKAYPHIAHVNEEAQKMLEEELKGNL